MKSFNTWEGSALIDKYGANFYHRELAKVAPVLIQRSANRWQVAIE